MLLYDEIEKQVKEEKAKKISETRKDMVKKGELEYIDGVPKLIIKKIDLERNLKKEREATTAYKVAQKVKVKPHVMKFFLICKLK